MIPLIQLENVSKSFGDLVLYNNINITIGQGDRTALIAKNGAGKSTLINIISGKESPTDGTVTITRDIRVGFLDQVPQFDGSLTVMESVFCSDSPLFSAVREYESALLSHDDERVEAATLKMDSLGAWDIESRAKSILTKLKITNLTQLVSQLSGGQKKRLSLAILLIDDPDVLVLDEPTNHLDMDMAQWLEDYFQKSNKSLLMVTHDRYFLDRVCNKIIEIDQKAIYTYVGNYSDFMVKRDDRIAQFNAQRDRAQNLYFRELEWMRRMPQARGTKQKYRKDAFWKTKEVAFQSRDDRGVKINSQTSRLGTKIFVADKVSKNFGDKVILNQFSYTFARYQRMGIIGRNGSGKSTFLNILTGKIGYDSGVLELGETVRFGYFTQQDDNFDNSKRVIDIITDIAEVVKSSDGVISATALLNQFLFSNEAQYGLVGKLSGGERRRLYLLSIIIQNPNFLILDEPTNDLDIMTLGILEEWLESYDGCLLVVSHDRYFMDKVADNMMIFDGDGKITFYAGNYTQYCNHIEEQKELESVKQSEVVAKNSKYRDESTKRVKLSFKEKQEFDALEIEIEQLETRKCEVETAMSSGELSSDDITKLSEEYSQLTEQIDDKSMRWLELSEKC